MRFRIDLGAVPLMSLMFVLLLHSGILRAQTSPTMEPVGAIEGQFDVGASGNASYTIPITTPPGTNGMAPRIALAYSSQGGIGPMGLGWQIAGLSAVTRGSKNVADDGTVTGVKWNKSDALYLDGERLIPIRTHGNEVEYRTRVDSMSKVIAYEIGNDGPTWLRVWTKAGLVMDYGTTPGSRVLVGGRYILVWACNRIADRFGNYMEFEYHSNDQGNYNIYMIRYTGNEDAGTDPYATIRFNYVDISPPSTSYLVGFPIVVDKRLTQVTTKFKDRVLREYRLVYEDVHSLSRFRLESIEAVGYDDSGNSTAIEVPLRPTRFGYGEARIGWEVPNEIELPRDVHLGSSASRGFGLKVVDFNGDGADDLLFAARTGNRDQKFAYRNNGGAWERQDRWAPPIPFVSQVTPQSGFRFVDVDQDGGGRPDLVLYRERDGNAEAMTWLNHPTRGWIEDRRFVLPVPLSIDGDENAGVAWIDLDGDDHLDLIWHWVAPDGTAIKGAATSSATGWNDASSSYTPDIPLAGPNYPTGPLLLDANADRHADLVYHRVLGDGSPEMQVYLWSATGWTRAPNDMFNLPFDPPVNPHAIMSTDLDGDGETDVLLSWGRSDGSERGTWEATTTGWKPRLGDEVPIDLAWGDDEKAHCRLADITDDLRPDLICHYIDSNGTILKHAFVNERTGNRWRSANDLKPRFPLAQFNTEGGSERLPVFLADLDGDRFPELLYAVTGTVDGPESGEWRPKDDLKPPARIAQVEKVDVGVRFVDLNSDGRTDITFHYIRENGQVDKGAWLNSGSKFVPAPKYVPPTPTATEKSGDAGTRFADVNGDGAIDIVYASLEGSTLRESVYINTGNPIKPWPDTPDPIYHVPKAFIKNEYGDYGTRLVDLNGDGLVDLLYLRLVVDRDGNTTREAQAWLNTLGSGWKPAPSSFIPPGDIVFVEDFLYLPEPQRDIEIHESQADQVFRFVSRSPGVMLSDLNGDRIPDMAYHHEYRGFTTRRQGQSIFLTRTRTVKSGAWSGTSQGWSNAAGYKPRERIDDHEGNKRLQFQPLDVNGDGLPDLVFSEKHPDGTNLSRTYLNNGGGFEPPNKDWRTPVAALGVNEGDQGYRFVDVNGDGLPDLVFSYKSSASGGERGPGAFLNTGVGWEREDSFGPKYKDNGVDRNLWIGIDGVGDSGVRFLDVNGDGLIDLVASRDSAAGARESRVTLQNKSRRIDLLRKIEDGNRVETHFGYESLTSTESGDFFEPAPLSPYPLVRAAPPAYVVENVEVYESQSIGRQLSYRYGLYRADARAGRPLGFAWRETFDRDTRLTEKVSFHQQPFELSGRTDKLETSYETLAGPQVLSHLTNKWAHSTTDGLPNDIGDASRYTTVRLESTSTVTYDAKSGKRLGQIDNLFTYDQFDCILRSETIRSDGTSVVTTSEFKNDPSRWLLGRLMRSRVRMTGDLIHPDDGDASGRFTQDREARFAYDPITGGLTEEIALYGTDKQLRTDYELDDFGNRTRSTTSTIGLDDRVTTTVYDAFGRFPMRTVNPLGHSAHTQFHPLWGVVAKAIDANGLVTETWYDAHGRPVKTRSPSDITTTVSYGYVPTGRTVSKVTATIQGLPPTHSYFDARGRILKKIRIGDGENEIHEDTEYDRLGRTTSVSAPYFAGDLQKTTQREFDQLGRVTRIIQTDGTELHFEYSGLITRSTDPLGRQSETETNLRGKVVRRMDPLGGTIHYYYDAGDRLTRITNVDGHEVIFKYDSAGHRVESASPDLGLWTYEYDAYGNLIWQVDAKGQCTTIEYDRLSRPLTRNEIDLTTKWTYDIRSHGIGQLASVSTTNGYLESYSFDEFGRVENVHVEIDNECFDTATTYDGLGRVRSIIYPTGFEVGNEYDHIGILRGVRNAHTNELYWAGVAFDALGRVVKEEYSNGVVNKIDFSQETGLVTGIASEMPDGELIQDWRYTYDKATNVTQRKEIVGSQNETFEYDALNRLILADRISAPAVEIEYDAAGSITYKSDLGRYDYDATSGPKHAVRRIRRNDDTIDTYSYDANGNSTRLGGRRVRYDASNRVQELRSDGALSRFRYTPDGRRFEHEWCDDLSRSRTISIGLYERIHEEMVPPFVTHKDWATGWHYGHAWTTDPPSLLHRRIVTNERLRHRYHIATPSGIAAIVEDVTEFFPIRRTPHEHFPDQGLDRSRTSRTRTVGVFLHYDALGSVTAITDSSGRIIDRPRYDAWGARIEVCPDDPEYHTYQIGYTGHLHLDHLQLVHMTGRVYDPHLARFISADQIIDGLERAVGFNHFAYVSNNPLRLIDVTGQWGFFKKIGRGIKKIGKGIAKAAKWVGKRIVDGAKWIKDNWRGVLANAAGIAVAVVATPFVGPVAAGALGGAVAGGLSAALYGGSLKDILMGVVNGAVTGAVAGMGLQAGLAPGSLGHAYLSGWSGGFSAAIRGENPLRGFAVGAISSGVASRYINQMDGFTGASAARVAANAAAGGTMAELTGGSFGNGAVSGAFVQLYSDSKQWARSGLSGVGRDLLSVAGGINALPYTVAGLATGGVVAWLTDGSVSLGNNAIQIRTNADLLPSGGITLGNVIVYNNADPASLIKSPYSARPIRLGLHEQIHTYQYGALGARFIGVYTQTWLLSATKYSPLEIAAVEYERNRQLGQWLPWNAWQR